MKTRLNIFIILYLVFTVLIGYSPRGTDHDLGVYPFTQTPMYSHLWLPPPHSDQPWWKETYKIVPETSGGELQLEIPERPSIFPKLSYFYAERDSSLLPKYLGHYYRDVGRVDDPELTRRDLERVRRDLELNWGARNLTGIAVYNITYVSPAYPEDPNPCPAVGGLLAVLEGDTLYSVDSKLDGNKLTFTLQGYERPAVRFLMMSNFSGQLVELPGQLGPDGFVLGLLPAGAVTIFIEVRAGEKVRSYRGPSFLVGPDGLPPAK